MRDLKILEKIKNKFHIINRLNTTLLLDKSTGAVYKLDKKAENFILKSKDSLDDVLLEELNCILKTSSEYKNKYFKKATELEKEKTHPKAFCLEISYDCNMSCDYCFARQNLNSINSKEPAFMSLEVVKKSIDYLLNTSNPVIEVDFFGGEPLLNWDVVKFSIDYIAKKAPEEGKKYYLALTTNGLNLTDEIMNFLNHHKVNLTFSLDGPPDIHNKNRKLKTGKGSFDKVFYKIKSALVSRNYENYYARGTFTNETLNFSKTAEFFINEGLQKFSLEPAVNTCKKAYLGWKNLPQIESEYEKLANIYLEKKGLTPFYHFNLDIYNTPCFEKRFKSCGAGVSYMAVAPSGKIYPCHQLAGEDKFLLGSVEEGILNYEVIDLFKKAHIFNKEDCLNCWAKFYCSGGCLANHYKTRGDLYKVDKFTCELMKIRLEYALALKARELEGVQQMAIPSALKSKK